jgi:hypothetical protein
VHFTNQTPAMAQVPGNRHNTHKRKLKCVTTHLNTSEMHNSASSTRNLHLNAHHLLLAGFPGTPASLVMQKNIKKLQRMHVHNMQGPVCVNPPAWAMLGTEMDRMSSESYINASKILPDWVGRNLSKSVRGSS